ncbi:MAG: GNAT family N-acetyltransferase [Polaromonas sp.]
MNISIKRYDTSLRDDWSSVLANSRNGIFIFDRNFIEYHGDRFTDFSAVAYLDGESVALLPASIDLASGHATSHAGLTFGGVVLKRNLRATEAILLINALLDSLKDWGAKLLTVKLLPPVFCTYPSADVDYALWQRGFSLVRRDLASVLPLSDSLPFNRLKVRSIKKALSAGLCAVMAPLDDFHALLVQVLKARHGASPVHSLAEMKLLAARFPDRIFVRGATKGDELLAGALIFNYGHIWHAQYAANSEAGRVVGALDLVIERVAEEARSKGITHLSFGASTGTDRSVLNEGLMWQKESYGARSITHDFYSGAL